MCDPSVHIATFPSSSHESSLEANEQHAIANYDDEQAQLIVESRQKRQGHPSIDKTMPIIARNSNRRWSDTSRHFRH
jgi:hypothetical protein